jgi:PAS domain S-box-containing protein
MNKSCCYISRYQRYLFVGALLCGLAASFWCPIDLAADEQTHPVRPRILSASEMDYPPFCIVDADGRATGFSVELLRAALAAMNHDVTYRIGPWDDVKGWLEQGAVKALPLVGRTSEREPFFDFTFPYMQLYGAIVVRKDTRDIQRVGDLQGRRVAVMKGDNAEEFLRREDRGIDIHTTATFEQALRELSEGRHDAVIIQRLVALRIIQETGLTNLQVIGRPIKRFRQDFSFAVKKGDHRTLALLNEGLALVIADGTYRHLHAKWFAALELPTDRRLVIGGDYNYPPFEYLDEQGRPTGYNIELTRAIARETGLEIEIRLGPWAQIREQFDRGEIDVLAGLLYSPGRGLSFDFTPPHSVVHYVGVSRKGEGPPPARLADLIDKRLVVQQHDIMHDFVVDNGLEDRTSVVDAQMDALRELSLGNHDYALVSRLTAMYWIETYGWDNLTVGRHPLLSPSYSYAVPKGQGALLAQFAEGLQIIDESGEYRRIYEKWMGVYKDAPPDLLSILRYAAMVIVPLCLLLSAIFLWSWSLRKRVFRQTAALSASEAFQRAMITCSPVALYSMTLEGVVLSWNAAAERILGWKAEEVIGKPIPIIPHARRAEFVDLRTRVAAGEQFVDLQVVRVKKDGTHFEGNLSIAPIRNDQGRIVAFMSAMEDITFRKQAEAALKESEQHFRNMADSGLGLIFTSGTDQGAEYFNQPWLDFTGRTLAQELGHGWTEGVHPDDLERCLAIFTRAFERRERYSMIFRLRRNDAEYRWIQNDGTPRYDSSGHFIGYIGHCLDITGSKRDQERIEHLNKVLRAIRDVNQLIAHERNRETLIQQACRIMVEHRGYACAFIVLTDDKDRPTAWSQSGMDAAFVGMDDMLQRGQLPPCCGPARVVEGVLTIEEEYLPCRQCAPGALCADSNALCAHLENEGADMGYLFVVLEPGVAIDPEERTLFADMAADIAFVLRMLQMDRERQKIEQEHKVLQHQMIQAQKMESVGRLAGGVAHDFNNMLSVILGYAELIIAKLAPEDPMHDEMLEIFDAAKRSRDITRQLLAFARKQTIAPEVLDPNETLEGMLKMLRRLIGEDIDLAWLPGRNVWPLEMDPSQIDQVLANLFVNARDAITGVGKITLETSNITLDNAYCADHEGFVPGQFVLLAVSDDGCGMDRETLDVIFEPFFTTKDRYQGTGLGLATVYGIVKQNNGCINVYSEPGKGTTFRIYLPRYMGETKEVKAPSAADVPMGRGEMILLVEDEQVIMKMGQTMLERLGYQVWVAETAGKALQLAQEHGNGIDLLITDVVMPEMNGRDLADRLHALHPSIKTLFMSGYTADIIAHRGILDDGVNFLQKPFSMHDLAAKVRLALERP